MLTVQQHPFIFSSERKYRLQRHLSFWLAWWLFSGIIYSIGPGTSNPVFFKNLLRSLTEALAYLPIHIFLAYSLIYFVIPYYLLKGKYFSTAIITLLCFAVSAFISVFISNTLIEPIRKFYHFTIVPSGYITVSVLHALMAGLRGGITIGGLAAAIKLMKHLYVEGQRNLQLQKENAESQLQILKAQVHPHFLFNTLNNIYSLTQDTSRPASKLVMGLSDMLRYMLYECNQPFVPLSKELKMVNEYIELERIRYGNKLEIHIDFPDNAGEFAMAPLLLLPFVENCFKHGTSNMLEHPWLNLHISIEQYQMTMKLINSKSSVQHSDHKQGIGIENVRRRLELIYPGKHDLVINDEEELFIVQLKLELKRVKTAIQSVQHPVIEVHA